MKSMPITSVTLLSESAISYSNRMRKAEWNPDAAQQVLVNMMFNMGRTRLGKFKNFRAALEDHDWKRAGVEGRDSLWYKQVTNRAERLMVRLESI